MIAERFSVSVGGAQLAGRRLGEGLPVVFLHAGVCDKRMWQAQMDMVAEEGWQGIAYDRRGYGETTSEDVAFNHVDDLEAVLKALDIHAAVFVGCSMGGGLAIDFALRHPGQVIGLVLIGTSVTGAPWIDNETEAEKQLWAVEEDAHERGDVDMINRVQAHIWLDGPRTSGGRVTGAARELFLDMNDTALRKPELTLEEKRESAWDRLGQVGAPTLLLVGDEDVSAIIERHEVLSEEMPNAFAAVLEGMAHIPSIERPELVNSMILEFLDAIEGGDDEDFEDDEDE